VALHGGNIPFGGTFLVFADYMRPAIRLAALMKQRVIYVFTHDSIGLGEDGPTHQPVEHLTSLRCIPGLTVLRPADAAEVVESWKIALAHRGGPVAIVLSRQKLPWLNIVERARIGVSHGAYVLQQTDGGEPQIVLLSTGSEVGVALNAAAMLESQGVRVRVVSAPSLELFAAQDEAYRTRVLPTGVPRVAVEAAHSMSWHRWVGDTGAIVSIDDFGASAPAPILYKQYGITAEHVTEVARKLI
jgi:transketolase